MLDHSNLQGVQNTGKISWFSTQLSVITHSLAVVTVMMALISGLLGKRERERVC